jgi:predicted RNA binding protein YcfA (HicA-like mRNA interferase family)
VYAKKVVCSLKRDRIGFEKRVKGDHHIYYHKDITEIINIQPKGHMRKH